jgi:hypothetical protein
VEKERRRKQHQTIPYTVLTVLALRLLSSARAVFSLSIIVVVIIKS